MREMSISDCVRDALALVLSNNTDEQQSAKETFSLSRIERKQLVMLHRILLAVNGDHPHYKETDEMKALQVMEGGYECEYSSEFADLNDPLPRVECELVWDILDMFRMLQVSATRLGGWDVLDLPRAESIVTFSGFDANDSSELR